MLFAAAFALATRQFRLLHFNVCESYVPLGPEPNVSQPVHTIPDANREQTKRAADDEAHAAARAKSNSRASIPAHSPPGLAIQRGPESQNPKTARHNRNTATVTSIVNSCVRDLVQTC
jgi:hypothetical protein